MKLSPLKSGVFAPLFFIIFLASQNAFASFILKNENVILERALPKIEQMGSELKQKTGVGVYVAAIESTGQTVFLDYAKDLSSNLGKPYVLLVFAKTDKKVDIISSPELEGKYGKEEILSPYPWKGTILPILTAKGKGDENTAALLNGYADIIERVAKSHGVELESAIGNDNRTTIAVVKYLVYATVVLVFGLYFYRRYKK